MSACKTLHSFLDCWSSWVSLFLTWSSCCSRFWWELCSWVSSYSVIETMTFFPTLSKVVWVNNILLLTGFCLTFWLSRSLSLSFCSRARLQLSALCLWQFISSVTCLSFCSTDEHWKTTSSLFLSDSVWSPPYLYKLIGRKEVKKNLCISLLLSFVGLSQFMSGLGQVSVPFRQLFARLVQLSLELLQLGGLAANFLLVRGQIPLQLCHAAAQI